MNATKLPIAQSPAVAGIAARGRLIASVLPVVGGCGLVAVAAHARVPVPGTDVPMTLQLLAVLVVGLTQPAARSVSALSLYLLLGAVGLPVLAPGSLGLFGATGGYIVGFIVAAWLASVLRGHGHGVLRLFLAATAAAGSVLLMGVAWRVVLLGGHVTTAVATGLTPFVGKAMVEVALAVTLVVSAHRLGMLRSFSRGVDVAKR